MDQNAGIKSVAFKRSVQKNKKEKHFLSEISYGWTLELRTSGPATTTWVVYPYLLLLRDLRVCKFQCFQRSTPEIYTFTSNWIAKWFSYQLRQNQ